MLSIECPVHVCTPGDPQALSSATFKTTDHITEKKAGIMDVCVIVLSPLMRSIRSNYVF